MPIEVINLSHYISKPERIILSLSIYKVVGFEMSKSALIVEGGAMRGIFAAGVLDAFMQDDFRPYDFAIGVSAGVSIWWVTYLKHRSVVMMLLQRWQPIRRFLTPRALPKVAT